MARSVQLGVVVVVAILGCVSLDREPRSYSTHSPRGTLRFECWETEADCESDATNRCGSGKMGPRGFRIVGRQELSSDGGRKLIMLDVECTR